MSGFTKHAQQLFREDIDKKFNAYTSNIACLLPKEYELSDIIALLKRYYPFDWRIIEERYIECQITDRKLVKMGRKRRYNMYPPDRIIANLPSVQKLLSSHGREKLLAEFGTDQGKEKARIIASDLQRAIDKRQSKIDKAMERMQKVEPKYLDVLMGFYERKNTSQKDRVYIMVELKKYYCPKVISFFKKIAHSEINFQLRSEAVRHLLVLGHYAQLRTQKHMQIHTENKKRKEYLRNVYSKETFNIKEIPEELEYRISNSKEQRIKHYDYFISHSSADYSSVQALIEYLNGEGYDVYCDWISDSDYLKRTLVSHATLSVIETRLQQSEQVIFVSSPASIASKWVKYELNYFHGLNKRISTISIDQIRSGDFSLQDDKSLWFIDPDYKKLKLM